MLEERIAGSDDRRAKIPDEGSASADEVEANVCVKTTMEFTAPADREG